MTADSSGLGTKPVARLALTMSVPTIVAQAANASYTICLLYTSPSPRDS